MNGIWASFAPGRIAMRLVPALFLLFAECGIKQVRPLDAPRPAYPFRATGPKLSHWAKADSLWALRVDPLDARLSLGEYRKAIREQRKVPELYARFAHACYFVASYHETNARMRDRLFREGQSAAEAGMKLHPAYRAVYRETGDEVEAARELDSSFVEVLYWYVVNLGRELNQESINVRRGNKARLENLNACLMDLDPAFYYAGPHRIAGVIPARLPEGDLKASKSHFESAIAMAPLYLANRVAYADYYAVRVRDKKTFLAQLSMVASVRADTIPEIAPENQLAQKWAKLLLANSESLFP
jgi:hypothetical protein